MENEQGILVIGIQCGRAYVKINSKECLFAPDLLRMTIEQQGQFYLDAFKLADRLEEHAHKGVWDGVKDEQDILSIGLRGFVEIYSVEWLTNPAIRQHMTPEERGNFLDDAVQLANRLDGGD